MPETAVYFYMEDDGAVPVLDWLKKLRQRDKRAYAKCVARIVRLAEMGHALRRPEADLLRNGIYELRARKGSVNYRILYFFHGRDVALLAHALTKEADVPEVAIERALTRKYAYEADPAAHTYELDFG